MPKPATKTGRSARIAAGTAKYDAHHTVLSKTYGALADLRRELSDSKTKVAERSGLLNLFASCADSQRAWLLLEDYFDKLALSRRDFAGQEWWPRLLAAQGRARLEELAILFLRSNRPLPTELSSHADLSRLAEIEAAELERRVLEQVETWLFPPAPEHLDGPRARLHLLCQVCQADGSPALHALRVRFNLFRPRSGERCRSLRELVELANRAPQDQEMFSPPDWAGSSFCAGIEAGESDAADPEYSRQGHAWSETIEMIRKHPSVFIAAVNGDAVGEGVSLINVCDLAIASDEAGIAMPEITRGAYPTLAGPSTQLRILRKHASWMILTGKRVDGRTAVRWGLVNMAVPANQLMDEARKVAENIAKFNPVTVDWSKKAIDDIPAHVADWTTALEYGRMITAVIQNQIGKENFMPKKF